jgi:transcriptional regulator with XRE-family HTH domain
MKRRAMLKKSGKKMKQIRERLGMSQREIVEALKYRHAFAGVSKSRSTSKPSESQR